MNTPTSNSQNLQELTPRIIVMGVGGAGGNAINNMIRSGLQGVEFIAANTDAQALTMSSAPHLLQMGIQLTEGLGAGSKPEIGAAAAEEAIEEIRAALSGAHMVFVTAGMGGGTGTGAAPVIGRIAREMGILTVGVVTKPFEFEGRHRIEAADSGLGQLEKNVDTLIVIPNQNLFLLANEQTTFTEAFEMADQVLHAGVACITDLMIKEGLINLDFADVRVVMSNMGKALMGTGAARGEDRGRIAAEAAVTNRLLDNVSLTGAKGVLVSIMGGKDLTLYEVQRAADRIREEAALDANIIVGAIYDETMSGELRVSVLATGIDKVFEEARHDARQMASASVPDFLARCEEDAQQAINRSNSPVIEPEQSLMKAPVEDAHGEPEESSSHLMHERSTVWQDENGIEIENTSAKVDVFQPERSTERPVDVMPGKEDFPPIARRLLEPKPAVQENNGTASLLDRIAKLGLFGHRDETPEPEPVNNVEFNNETNQVIRDGLNVTVDSKKTESEIQDESVADIPAFFKRKTR